MRGEQGRVVWGCGVKYSVLIGGLEIKYCVPGVFPDLLFEWRIYYGYVGIM